MGFFSPGTPSISSTQGMNTNPSTSALIAEVDSTQLAPFVSPAGTNVQVTWIVGGSTIVTWQLEQALSTGLDMSTAGRSLIFAWTPTNQTSQFMTKHRAERGDRFRARTNAGIAAGVVAATIIIEPLD